MENSIEIGTEYIIDESFDALLYNPDAIETKTMKLIKGDIVKIDELLHCEEDNSDLVVFSMMGIKLTARPFMFRGLDKIVELTEGEIIS